MLSKTVNIPKISCGHCTGTIERQVGDLHGVIQANADKDKKQATIDWDETVIDWKEINALLIEIGFPVQP